MKDTGEGQAPKGKSKRCGDQPYVGGVPTKPGELVWVLRDGQVKRIRGRGALSANPERVVVTPSGLVPKPEWFSTDQELVDGVWVGFSSQNLARGATARRRGRGLYEATVAASPALGERVGAGVSHVRSVMDMHTDPATTQAVVNIAQDVRAAGGRALVVGGATRDMVFGWLHDKSVTIKDADLEIYGLAPEKVQEMIARRYSVDLTGASFAVLKANVPGATEQLDISVPRRERATGSGHRDFVVTADPTLSFAQAAYRRDFTIGAMGYDPLTGELLDPYGGAADLASGVLRHVSDAFDEDPLRALRAARFAARFGLRVHPDTVERCRRLRNQADALASERKFGELAMTMMQAGTPGVALYVMDQIDWIDIFPEIAILREIEQSPNWHPEGNVFIHTAEVLNYWGTHLRTGNVDDDLVVSIASMCHDLGKATTTRLRDGKFIAHGHEGAGVAPAQALLGGLGQKHLGNQVSSLIAHHLAPVQLGPEAGDNALRRLSTKVARLDLLCLVSKADQGGRPPKDPTPEIAKVDAFYKRLDGLGLISGPPEALARGEMLIEMGQVPGPKFKEWLGKVYEAQLDGEVTDEAAARTMLAGLVTQD